MVTKIEEKLDYIGDQLRTIANGHAKGLDSWSSIRELSEDGKLNEYVTVGDTLDVKWHDNGDTYASSSPVDAPMIVGDLNHTVTYEDGTTGKATGLEWLYTIPYGIQFDAPEALIGGVALTAGTTYNFTGASASWGGWGSIAGKSYQFVTTNNIPSNAMGVLNGVDYNTNTLVGKSISFYADGKTDTVIETVTLTEGSSGTNIGTMDGTGNINHYQRVCYGSNRWRDSALRQYLNSDKAKGEWWKPQHKWDRHPSQASTVNGFLYGMDKEFLNQIKKVKIVTANSSVTDGGTLDTTYDRFFPLALNEKKINPQIAGEGDTWAYYTDLANKNGRTGSYAVYQTYSELAKAKINAKSSTQYAWLRSCYRNNALHTWLINPSGSINHYHAYHGNLVAPACYI